MQPVSFPPESLEARQHWTLDPEIRFLNHGSFGACPRPVLELQQELRDRLEREPVLFLHRELEPMLDAARSSLAAFVGADPDDLAFVPNATAGVNTVLQGLDLAPGDEILITDHEYNACANAVRHHAARAGAQVTVAHVPWPLSGPDEVVAGVLAAVTPRTKLVLIDHVTSQSGILVPVEPIVAALRERGIDTLVDGAHAPGMLRLELDRLGAAYYTGNCHKWLCAPKGAAFLHVRRDRQQPLAPMAISHGWNSPRSDRSRFRLLFDWGGTCDPTPWLCVPAAIRFLQRLLPGGFEALRAHNHALACAARAIVAPALGTEPPCPDAMLGSLASLPLPGTPRTPPAPPLMLHPLQRALFDRAGIEVPLMGWPAGRWHLRLSAQIYNRREDYEALARALRELVPETCAIA